MTNPKNEKLQDLTPREILTFAPLMAAALFIGIYPKPMFQILQQPVAQLVQTVRPGEMKTVLAAQPAAIPVMPASERAPASKPLAPATTSSKPLPPAIAAVRTN